MFMGDSYIPLVAFLATVFLLSLAKDAWDLNDGNSFWKYIAISIMAYSIGGFICIVEYEACLKYCANYTSDATACLEAFETENYWMNTFNSIVYFPAQCLYYLW